MRKYFIFMSVICRFLPVLALTAAAVSGCKADLWNCNTMRSAINRDKQTVIADLTEQIKDIENDEEEKSRSLGRLQSLYQQIGAQYLDQKLWDMAIPAFSSCLKYGKKTPVIYYSMAVAYANRGAENKNNADLDRAELYYGKALEIDSSFYEAGYGLAVLLFFEKDEKEKALAIMEETAARHPKFYTARFGLGRFYYELRQPEKALVIYRTLQGDLEKLPDSQAIREYREQCDENIRRIMSEQK